MPSRLLGGTVRCIAKAAWAVWARGRPVMLDFLSHRAHLELMLTERFHNSLKRVCLIIGI